MPKRTQKTIRAMIECDLTSSELMSFVKSAKDLGFKFDPPEIELYPDPVIVYGLLSKNDAALSRIYAIWVMDGHPGVLKGSKAKHGNINC